MNIDAHRLPDIPVAFSALIDGQLIPASEREPLERENPAHRRIVSLYPKATQQDVKAALTGARRAVDGGNWQSMSGADRARLLLRVAGLIDKYRAELGAIESLEVGKPSGLIDREIEGSIAHWEYAAALARHAYGDTYDTLGGDAFAMALRAPVGVVTMIAPWNYPLLIVSQKLPFALAMGCTAIVKPSELTSGTALRLGEILLEAGVPAGVVNIIAGTGLDLGEALCTAPEVDMISFTGSTQVGRIIGAQAGHHLKRVSLELGGKSAHIVCADSNLELAAEKVALGFTRNAGQACVSGSRLLVERSVADEFVTAVQAEVGKLRIGDPLDAETTMGPLVSAAQRSRVEGFINAGIQSGAPRWSMASSGTLPADGHYVQPTIFSDVDPAAPIAQEEIFGPVLSVIPFDGFADAVRIANGTPYGLAAGVWTKDLNKALQFGRALKAGSIEVNTFLAGKPELPIIGHGDSGVGRERGRFAIDEFTELKTVQVQLNPL